MPSPRPTPGEALRNAGVVPLPRLWVKQDDLEMILWMAKKYEAEVNAIRHGGLTGKP